MNTFLRNSVKPAMAISSNRSCLMTFQTFRLDNIIAFILIFILILFCLRYTALNKRTIIKSLQSEKLALTLRHRNIVTTYHINEASDPAFIIMEYVGEWNQEIKSTLWWNSANSNWNIVL